LLSEVGLDPERVKMFHMSAAMAETFVENAVEIVSSIEALGANPLRTVGKMLDNNTSEAVQ
jgi:coenzyme F420-reducing hydrogenase delta subunit